MADQSRSPEDVEVLDFGPRRPRHPGLIGAIVAACCALVVGVTVARANGDREPAPAPSPEVSSTPADAVPTTAAPVQDLRRVWTLNLSWLGARSGYNVFVRTGGAVYRAEPRADRVVRTAVPGLASSGPVTFLPVRSGVLVRPLDFVPSYFIPDDEPIRRLGGSGGVVLPGPGDRHVWVEAGDTRLELVGPADGHSTAIRITIPSGLNPLQLVPDGRGYPLAVTDGGVYDLRPGGATRVADGEVIAVGPTRLLIGRCSGHGACSALLLDRSFTVMSPSRLGWNPRPASRGVISPDGGTAALVTDRDQPVVLADLRTGRLLRTQVDGLYSAGDTSGQVAFSPDSRWLFVLSSDRQVYAIDVATGRARLVFPQLSGVAQIAVRPGA